MASSPASSNLWQSKPWWCQPWSILLTGMIIMGGSWLLFHRLWLTGGVSLGISLWWYYFLWVVPQLYQEQNQDQDPIYIASPCLDPASDGDGANEQEEN